MSATDHLSIAGTQLGQEITTTESAIAALERELSAAATRLHELRQAEIDLYQLIARLQPDSTATEPVIASHPDKIEITNKRPKPKPTVANLKRGRPKQYTDQRLAELAPIALDAISKRITPSVAIAAHLKTSRGVGVKLCTRMRRLGLLPPAHTDPKQHQRELSERPTEPPAVPVEVPPLDGFIGIDRFVEDYFAAVRDHKRPLAQLAFIYDVDTRTVQSWLAMCRERGLIPPRDQPQLPADERLAGLPKSA